MEILQLTFNHRNHKMCIRVPHRIQVTSSHKPSDAVHTVRCLRKHPRTKHRSHRTLSVLLILQDFSSTQTCSIHLGMQIVHCDTISRTGFPTNQAVDHVNSSFPQLQTKYRNRFFQLTDTTFNASNSVVPLRTSFVHSKCSGNTCSTQRGSELIGCITSEVNWRCIT